MNWWFKAGRTSLEPRIETLRTTGVAEHLQRTNQRTNVQLLRTYCVVIFVFLGGSLRFFENDSVPLGTCKTEHVVVDCKFRLNTGRFVGPFVFVPMEDIG